MSPEISPWEELVRNLQKFERSLQDLESKLNILNGRVMTLAVELEKMKQRSASLCTPWRPRRIK